jgi:chromosome partitioning protein
MATIITIANQKGGVAKTTTTRHLAYFLDQVGRKTLIIDNDHQANLTQYFGLDPIECERNRGTMYEVVLGEKALADIIVPVSPNLAVAPSSLSLAEAGARLIHETDVNGKIRQALQPLRQDFEIILIDCGPNLERLLINALVASRWVLIPTKTDSLSISGIPALLSTVQKVRSSLNPSLELLGVLPTIYHQGRIADEKALGQLREQAGGAGVKVFEPIPAATNYDKAADAQQAVFAVFPDTPGRQEYEYLANLIACL